jgi:energy-coupling factor transporter ATP-binding protein EcfA2
MALKKLRLETVFNKLILEMSRHEDVELRFVKVADGVKIPALITDEKVCEMINKKQFMQIAKNLARPVYEDYKEMIGNPEIFIITAATASQLFDTAEISSVLQLKEQVKPFCFLSDDAYTFCRIPFDPTPGTPMPGKWDRFLSNYTNREAVCMWIGSLFFADSDRSQYLWLYGKGGNGKSTLARVIARILGKFVRFEQTPSKEDKYWTNGLIGKRLIVVDDCNNYGFVKTGLFKSLTGSSKVRVEAKYGNPYDADLDCKFLFTSNELPLVSDDLADQRRIILSTAVNKDRFDYDADFEKNLEADLPAFISACMDMYLASCADGRPIPTDDSEAKALAELFDEEVQAWVESVGEIVNGHFTPVTEFRNVLATCRLNPRNVYRYLENKGVVRVAHRFDGKVAKALCGFKLKIVSGRF